MDFRKRLRFLMASRNISQRELADMAGCSPASISRYINDLSMEPPISVIVNLADKLDVSIDYLLGRTNIPAVRSADDEFSYVMYQCYARASDRDKQLVGTVLNEYLTEEEQAMNYSIL